MVAGFPHPYTLGCWKVAFSPSQRLKAACQGQTSFWSSPCPRLVHARLEAYPSSSPLRATPKESTQLQSSSWARRKLPSSYLCKFSFSPLLASASSPSPVLILEILPKKCPHANLHLLLL